MKIFESLLCRITLVARSDGRAEISVFSKIDPSRPPFRQNYDWGTQATWQRDLRTLVESTGAEEIHEDAA